MKGPEARHRFMLRQGHVESMIKQRQRVMMKCWIVLAFFSYRLDFLLQVYILEMASHPLDVGFRLCFRCFVRWNWWFTLFEITVGNISLNVIRLVKKLRSICNLLIARCTRVFLNFDLVSIVWKTSTAQLTVAHRWWPVTVANNYYQVLI